MAGFRKGALGSPFQTEYYGNQGMEMGEAGKPSERGPKIGSGALGKRVTMEVSRDDSSKGGKSGKRA
jgi:hypothetical protein